MAPEHSDSEDAAEASSPCTQQCELDDTKTCMSCLRTIDEIIGWRQLDDAGRAAVLSRLARVRAETA